MSRRRRRRRQRQESRVTAGSDPSRRSATWSNDGDGKPEAAVSSASDTSDGVWSMAAGCWGG
jgi:hypothetical protein